MTEVTLIRLCWEKMICSSEKFCIMFLLLLLGIYALSFDWEIRSPRDNTLPGGGGQNFEIPLLCSMLGYMWPA